MRRRAWGLSSPCSATELLCSLASHDPFLTRNLLIYKMGKCSIRVICLGYAADPRKLNAQTL